MTDSTALGDRMKAYEHVTRQILPRRTHAIIRVDIRAAHSLLRGAARPYDEEFMAAMNATAEALCTEISGAAFAYTQSDEISVLVTDFGSLGTEPWFGGIAAKQISISAAVATAALNEARPGRRALFDSRVFTIPDRQEVANYFLWRQRDAVRNSISMAAQAKFSPRQLHGVNTGRMQEMLWSEHGINWNDYPDACKRGRVTVRKTGERETTWTDKRTGQEQTTLAMRSWWETTAAPHFATAPEGWIMSAIPIPGAAA